MMEANIELINAWSKTKNIPIFPMEKDKELKKIDWKHQEENSNKSLSDFLDFLIIIQPKFVMLEFDTFDYSILENDYKSTTKGIKEAESNEILPKFSALNKLLKEKDGKIYFLELSFVNNGFCFSFCDYADWSSEYSEYSEIIEEYNNIDYLLDANLINDETLKLAKELANFGTFNKATNKAQRELAASLFFKNRQIGKRVLHNISSIIEYADSIKKMEIEDLIN